MRKMGRVVLYEDIELCMFGKPRMTCLKTIIVTYEKECNVSIYMLICTYMAQLSLKWFLGGHPWPTSPALAFISDLLFQVMHSVNDKGPCPLAKVGPSPIISFVTTSKILKVV